MSNFKEEHEKQLMNSKKTGEEMLDKKQNEYEKKVWFSFWLILVRILIILFKI
jgi:hypothetical protein